MELSRSNQKLIDKMSVAPQPGNNTVASRTPEPVITAQHSMTNQNLYNFHVALPPDPPQAANGVQFTPKNPDSPHQRLTPPESMDDHLQRCLSSVQGLASTILCTMNGLRGLPKVGNADVHGSCATVVSQIKLLPVSLECLQCTGRVSLSEFDLAKAAWGYLGSCTCIGRGCLSSWKPCSTIRLAQSNSSEALRTISVVSGAQDNVLLPPIASLLNRQETDLDMQRGSRRQKQEADPRSPEVQARQGMIILHYVCTMLHYYQTCAGAD